MSRADMFAQMTLLRVVSVTRGEKEDPLELDWPWSGQAKKADVTDEERAELVIQLKRSSAFGQIRNPEE